MNNNDLGDRYSKRCYHSSKAQLRRQRYWTLSTAKLKNFLALERARKPIPWLMLEATHRIANASQINGRHRFVSAPTFTILIPPRFVFICISTNGALGDRCALWRPPSNACQQLPSETTTTTTTTTNKMAKKEKKGKKGKSNLIDNIHEQK